MIAIRKGEAPPSLIRDGEKHVRKLCADYDANPGAYRTGKAGLEFRDSIYQAAKGALNDSHGGKCCYCEIVIPTPYAHAHVEHWRPKNSPRQSRGAPYEPPGYYWLAYDWKNLLLSCFHCNNRKSVLFPVEDPSTRVRDHRTALENEVPILLKPDSDNPQDHIRFDEDVPVGITDRGTATIEVLCLDSPKHSFRRKHLAEVRECREIFNRLMEVDHPIAREEAERQRQKLEDAVLPRAPYSAMIAAYLEANPLPARAASTGGVTQISD